MSQNEPIVGLGARSDHIATAPSVDPARLALSPEERAVLGCIGRVAQIQDVLSHAGLSEPLAIAALLSLRAKGAIVPARVVKPSAAAEAATAAMNEQNDLDPARRKEILDFERVMDGLDHFAVLGVPTGAAAADARKAFHEASRRYHPDRFYGKNLGSFRGRIDRIFRRLSEANQVLTDPARRDSYLRQHPELSRPPEVAKTPAASAPLPDDPARAAERRARFARHPYLAKTARLNELVARAKAAMAKGDFATACADLNIASQADAKRPDLAELLLEARRKHDAHRGAEEMKKAKEAEAMGDTARALAAYKAASTIDAQNGAAAFRAARAMVRAGEAANEARVFAQRAVDADSQNADYRVLLGNLCLEAGMKAVAKKQYEEALKLDPDHAEAKKHVKKWWPF